MKAVSQSVTNMRAHEACKTCEPRSANQNKKANHNITYARVNKAEWLGSLANIKGANKDDKI